MILGIILVISGNLTGIAAGYDSKYLSGIND
jgi:hypothetical protein